MAPTDEANTADAHPGDAHPGDTAQAGSQRYFPDLPPAIDLPAMEHDVLARWQDGKFFERSLDDTAGRPLWTFYEGPPTTNGMPGVHHIEARVFKDVFPRFKTMQGFHVPRQAGWDCHGLPVEVAVERELGLSGKKAIESYGIAEFNARCRESAQRHVDAFEELTVRLGYWVDLQHAYRTMDTSYIESVWWSLKEIFTKGLLVKDFRISPYCPRCETPLSDHEMGQPDVYRQVSDPAVTVRFPLLTLPDGANPLLNGADLLVWTTTPWTLVSNTAVAVHPDESYAIARKPGDGDTVVVAEKLVPKVLGEGWHVVATVPGASLVGATYRPPFTLVEVVGCAPGRARRLRHHRGRHRPGPPGAGLRRRRHGDRPGPRPAGGEPGPPGRPVRGMDPAGRRDVLQGRGRAAGPGPDRARRAVPRRAVRAQLPALLAVPHAAAVLRAAVLVHPHHPDQGPDARRERAHQLAAAHHQARPVRRVAAQQRGLGAVPDPVLGHPAADLGVRRGTPDLRRVARRAQRAGRAGPVRAGPAPPVRGRGDARLPRMRRRGPAGAGGDRRLVRLRVDAVRPARRSLAEPRAVPSRPTRRSSSARPSTRPAAGSTR